MKKRKIDKIALFHCGFIYTGGGERIVLEEVRGLREKGYRVDCFVPNYDPRLSYPDLIQDYGIKTLLPQLPGWFPLRFALQLTMTCLTAPLLISRFKKYDLFIGANQPGAYLAWIISGILRKPYLVYLNQPNRVLYSRDHEDWQAVKDYYYLNKIINSLVRKPVEILDRISITKSQSLLINGQFVAKEIIKIYKPVSFVNCPGGALVAPQKALNIDRLKGQVRVNGHTPEKPYILLTSRHVPWKRFDWAIEVVAKVVEKYYNLRLVIPGNETPFTPKLKTLAQKLGIADRVVFTGEITQKSLWKLYQNAYLYLFPSPKEDLGIVVEEAQAAGVPVVAWNSGGPTVTVVDGETGFLAKPFDKEEMAKKVLYLLNNPKIRDKMGKKAREHIKKNFSWEHHLNILDREIRKLSV